jgi:hypothetical protein
VPCRRCLLDSAAVRPGYAYDRSLCLRAAAVAALASLVTLLVVAATDAGEPWAARLGMTSALAPLSGALGTLAAVRLAAARGELRALQSLGVEPARSVLGAIAGGIAAGIAGPLAAAAGLADLAQLFPRPLAARSWITDDAGILHEITLGLRVGPGGALALEAPRAVVAALPAGAAALAIVALALAAIVCPVWIAAVGVSPVRRAGVGAAAVGAAIAAFQGVAAGRVPAALLVVAPLVLLSDATIARRSARPR